MRLADAVGDRNRVHLALLPQLMQNGPPEPSAGELYQRYVLGGWRLFTTIYELLEKGSMEGQETGTGNQKLDVRSQKSGASCNMIGCRKEQYA
jgi:hypothetical protein